MEERPDWQVMAEHRVLQLQGCLFGGVQGYRGAWLEGCRGTVIQGCRDFARYGGCGAKDD